MINFQPKNLFVFDIETVADNESAVNLLGEEYSGKSLAEQREGLHKYHLEITEGKNAFLRQPFHKIVAISFLRASLEYTAEGREVVTLQEVRSGGSINSSEKDLIKGFFHAIDKFKPRLVSFNGKTFDLPVLKYRAMKYGISSEVFHLSGNKYEGYNHRYALNWHCDLIDALSDFGSSARIKLNEVCAVLGIAGKLGTDGSQVEELYDNNQLQDIRNYCETDVINTYLVYLRYALHTGKLNINNYNRAIDDIALFLSSSSENHFVEYYQQWGKANGGKFNL